jgi:gliding motility-associated-like protein
VKSFYWHFNDTTAFTSTLQNPSNIFSGPGTYQIFHIAISNFGCRDTIKKPVNITPPPIAGFILSYNSGINLNTIVTFTDVSQNALGWSWVFGDGNTSVIQHPNNTYLNNGTYTITQTVTDQFGCKATASRTVGINNIKENITELIPNAISPNGDLKNDIWRLDFINAFYPNATIEIFNRWGQSLFYSDGYSIPWDGTYKGDPLPVATYYYVINLNDPNRENNVFKGTILLMK